MPCRGRVGVLRCHRLAQLVTEHESRLVLDVQVAAELQSRVALGTVHEDRDGEKVGADRKLSAGEDRPRW